MTSSDPFHFYPFAANQNSREARHFLPHTRTVAGIGHTVAGIGHTVAGIGHTVASAVGCWSAVGWIMVGCWFCSTHLLRVKIIN